MTRYRIQRAAGERIDEIYLYTHRQWGEAQADLYIRGLFARIEAIAARHFPWRPVPVEFGVSGFFCRYERHFIYWKVLHDGSLGIVTILHERMHQLDAFRRDEA